jgi:acyl-coenzyme A thioesterase PaaI-like protein
MILGSRLRTWRDRLVINLYPPFFFTGTRCVHVSLDYRHARMELPLTLLTRNLNGSQFGGAIFAMTDPVFALLLFRLLGPGHVIWAKRATIEFRRPGRSRLRADFHVTDEDLAAIAADLAAAGRHVHEFHVEVVDRTGEVVARVEQQVYVRREEGR